jgi:hypothetical protein
MSPIAKALRRQTPAERLDASIYIHPLPVVAHAFTMLMLLIALKIDNNVPPGGRVRVKGGGA